MNIVKSSSKFSSTPSAVHAVHVEHDKSTGANGFSFMGFPICS